MSYSVGTGPSLALGPMLGTPRSPDPQPGAGPGITYQGDSIPDVRFAVPNSNVHLGTIRTHLDSAYPLMTDYVPSASAATPVNIAPAQNTASGTAMTLAGPSAGITTNLPFRALAVATDLGQTVFGDGGVQTAALSLDIGFTTAATVAGSAVVTLPSLAALNQNVFYVGQNLVIAGAGSAGGTFPLFATVTAINGTALTLSAPALATLAAAPVGQGDALDPFSPVPSAAWAPRLLAGPGAIFNPLDAVARGVGIACSAAGGGGAFLVRGWDVYGMPMSELITHPGGAVVQYGRKAFKHLASVTPQFTDASRTYSVGTSDLFGFNFRADKIEYLNIYFSGQLNGTSAGFTPPDYTSPALPTTGDVRGTIQVGNRGPLGTGNGYGTTAINGTQRIAFFMSIPLANILGGTPATPALIYGANQA